MNRIRAQIKRVVGRYTNKLLLVGLIGVSVYNWWLWQRDKALAERLLVERLRVPKLSPMPRVSTLVAAWNEHDHIDNHIRSFLALSYPAIELILCAGGTDDTLQRARCYAGERVTVLEQRPGEGKQRALRRCLKYASGEIFYLTDADCIYVDEALIRLLAPLVEEGEQAATGGSRPLAGQAGRLLPGYLWASDVMSRARTPVYCEGLLGRNTAITRCALDQSGGFAFTAPIGTDYQLARQLVNAGIKIRHVNASIVPSEYPETLQVYRRQRSRWLRSLLIHGLRHGAKHDVQVTLKTIVTGMVMLLMPLATVAFGSAVLVPWSLLVAHAAVSKLRYALFTARLYQHPVPRRLLIGIVPLVLIDFVIWALPILDLLNPKRRNQW